MPQLTATIVVQLQCFVQPIEDDFVFVRQGYRFTMILGSIFTAESNELLWSLQRIVHLLRLIAGRQNVPLCVQNKARAFNLFGDTFYRERLDHCRKKIGKPRSSEGPNTLRYSPAQVCIVLHRFIGNLLALDWLTCVQSGNCFFGIELRMLS
jgi:hypothetical protein